MMKNPEEMLMRNPPANVAILVDAIIQTIGFRKYLDIKEKYYKLIEDDEI